MLRAVRSTMWSGAGKPIRCDPHLTAVAESPAAAAARAGGRHSAAARRRPGRGASRSNWNCVMLSTWPVPSIREGMELSLERWQPVGFHGNEDHAAFDLIGLHGEPHLLVITRVIAAFSEHMDRGSHHVTRALFEQNIDEMLQTGNSPPMSARCPRLQLGHERSRRDGIIVPDCATAGRAVEGEGIARSEGPIHRHLQDSRR